EGHKEEKLGDASDQQCPSRAEQLFKSDLQADYEEEENQADLRNQFDGLLIFYPGETDLRADNEACEQVGKDQRLFQSLRDEREQGRDYKSKADIGEKTMLVHEGDTYLERKEKASTWQDSIKDRVSNPDRVPPA